MAIDDARIRDVLVSRGQSILQSPRKFHPFAGHLSADRLVNSIERTPHAFVLGCIMDRQVKAEKAWAIPYEIKMRSGGFSMRHLRRLSTRQVARMMTRPTSLHRFPEEMATNFVEAIEMVATRYGGDASRMWSDCPSSATVVYRFLEFRGVGLKISTMAANVLVRIFKVPLADYYSIDISPDVHVRRVFSRLGLTAPDATPDQIAYRARSLWPEFPGLLDVATFHVGRDWCRPQNPLCGDCYLAEVCAYGRRSAR